MSLLYPEGPRLYSDFARRTGDGSSKPPPGRGPSEDPATIKCPRCKTDIDTAPDRSGLVVCPSCGAKLRNRPPAASPARARVPPAGAAPAVDFDSMLDSLDGPRVSNVSTPAAQPPRAPAAAARNPTATLPPGTPLKSIPRPDERPASDHGAAPPTLPTAALDVLLAEVRAVRRLQEEILALMRRGATAPPSSGSGLGEGMDDDAGVERGFTVLDDVLDTPPATGPLRASRSKTVLLIDDDPKARAEAMAALERAQVPARAVSDGNAGLAAIAEERPDVIVLELELKGSMAGKDVVNMIKATMEWVDIPIVLYTRTAIANQKEARTIHGADEYVVKGPTSTELLVTTIVSVFRRG